MICPNCGGEHADWALRCPYCDTVNEESSERIYMEHMNDIRDRLDDIDDNAKKTYKDTISKSAKKTFLIVGIIAGVLAATVILIAIIHSLLESRYESMRQRNIEWQKEEYVKLDAWYDREEYDEILTEYYDYILDSKYDIFNWSHYYFIIEFYDDYRTCQMMHNEISNKEASYDSVGLGLYSALNLICRAQSGYMDQLKESYILNNETYGLSEEETIIIAKWQKETLEIFEKDLNINQKELYDLYEKCKKDDYVDLEKCFEEAKIIAEREGIH